MQLEPTQLRPGSSIDTDICIIGAGPAGLVIAERLAEAGRDVVLVESAASDDDQGAQALNDGDVAGDGYAGLRATRHRALGGTTHTWNTPTPNGVGAKYLPLDRADFEPRWPEAAEGWPVRYDELAPFYRMAQQRCGLGPFAYEAADWLPTGRAPRETSVRDRSSADGSDSALSLDPSLLVSRVYQLGARSALLDPLVAASLQSTALRLLRGATAVGVAEQRDGCSVTLARGDGGQFTARARRVVLAAGAVENARLLLVAAATSGGGVDRSGWLGRGFMEHPRDRTLSLTLAAGVRPESLSFYDLHVGHGGTTVLGRLAPADSVVRAADLLNFSATLFPRPRPSRDRLRQRLGPVANWPSLRRWLPMPGHGWCSHRALDTAYDGFTLLLNLEQPPRRENAITLGTRRDAFGVSLPVLHWRWHTDDHARLVRVRDTVARALNASGVGHVTCGPDEAPNPNAHHHAGTTRMHRDPRHGVVDPYGRVHGTASLYVAGASTFPTAGFANPMLTIVALALRLADHLVDRG